MIDRIAPIGSPSPASPGAAERSDDNQLAIAVGGAIVTALTERGPVGTSLPQIANDALRALSSGAGPVGDAQLERAVLDFARDAKAFAIGHADRGPEDVRVVLDEALKVGGAGVDQLGGLGFGPADIATTIFERASAHLQTF